MNTRTTPAPAAAIAMLVLGGTAQASLVNQGDGTVLDTATHLIWLQNWNMNGAQNYFTQTAWAQNLVFAGSSDWVIPTSSDFRSLAADVSDPYDFNAFTAIFSNVQQPYSYFSSSSSGGPAVDGFSPRTGSINGNALAYVSRTYAVAVRTADADPAAAVPEPQTLALVLVALGAMALTRRV